MSVHDAEISESRSSGIRVLLRVLWVLIVLWVAMQSVLVLGGVVAWWPVPLLPWVGYVALLLAPVVVAWFRPRTGGALMMLYGVWAGIHYTHPGAVSLLGAPAFVLGLLLAMTPGASRQHAVAVMGNTGTSERNRGVSELR